MTTMTRRSLRLIPLVLLAWGCQDFSDSVLVFPTGGDVEVRAFMDANGNGAREGGEPPVSGLPVSIRHWNAAAPVDFGVTDAEGVARLVQVGLGTFRVDISPSFLSDTLVLVQSLDAPIDAPITVRADTTVILQVGVAYPFVDLRQLQGHPPGRRVFSSGIVLNTREAFGDGVVHLQLDTVAIRATRVDRVGLGVGDSVRIVGRTRIQDGRMTLDSATVFSLAGGVVLVLPADVTSSSAASAGGGRLDARLVQVREALITAARAQGDDWLVTANDGTGPVDVVFRDYLLFDRTALVTGNTLIRATGLLRPVPGGGRWQLFPRGGGDIAVRVAPPGPPGG
jgi:hypothetical protein